MTEPSTSFNPYARPNAAVVDVIAPSRTPWRWVARAMGAFYIASFIGAVLALAFKWDVFRWGLSTRIYAAFTASLLLASPLLIAGVSLLAARKSAVWASFSVMVIWLLLLIGMGFARAQLLILGIFAATFALAFRLRMRGALK